MEEKLTNYWKYSICFVTIVFAVCFAFLIASKINLVTADLGRHIENGRIIIHGGNEAVNKILHTNYYSYTQPEFPFINHHWGIGIIFYFVWVWIGFTGLSIVYIGLAVMMFLLSLWLAIRRGNIASAFICALLLMPLLTYRREVRPEIITYLFSLIFYAVLWAYSQKKIGSYLLYVLIILQIFWVNVHIGFFFGEMIAFFFLFREIVRREKDTRLIRTLSIVFAGIVVASVINPSFIAGALYPLSIFKNYGYELFENQSVSTLEQLGFYSFEFAVYKIMLFITILATLVYIVWKRVWSFLIDPLTLIMILVGILSFMAVRSHIMFAIFAVPYLSLLSSKLLLNKLSIVKKLSVLAVSIVLLMSYTSISVRARGPFQGIGLLPNIEGSAQFFLANNVEGPIFNDYDNGSYIEFELKGKEKVFVDNRPEAYSVSFFQDEYIKAQSDGAIWDIVSDRYDFNVIWFNRNNLTPWAKYFMNTRAVDPAWALVYLDDHSVIFVKRVEKNKAIIEKFEIKKT